MSSDPVSIMRSPPETENGGDSETQQQAVSTDLRGPDVNKLSTNVGQEILRNLSTETPSTDYSSGIHSLDLLMEIYPTISESGSVNGDSQKEHYDKTTVVHVNNTQDTESLSFFSLASSKAVISHWLDDKPFDEESLRALSDILSERGENSKNVISKGDAHLQEYILPPANHPGKVVGQSVGENSATNKRSPSPLLDTLAIEFEEQEEAVNRSYYKNKKETERKKKNIGISRRLFWMAVLGSILLLGIAIVLGFMTSRLIHQRREQNQAAAATSELNEPGGESEANGLSTNSTDDRPWGTLVTYFDPIPEDVFPLGLCAGDCDRDADCAEGLVCYQRGANDPVPYCYDGENDSTRTDYCTYPSFTGEMPGSEADECVTTVTVEQQCFLSTDNVIVVNFQNCDPQDGDWLGVFPDGTTFGFGTPTELVGEEYLNWAYTCGTNDCNDSPLSNAVGFPTEYNSGFDFPLLRVYLLRDSADGPPFRIVGKSEPFEPTEICE